MLLQKEQNRVMALVGITFVVLIVVLLFYINYRRKNRLYKQIVRESVDWLAKERQFSKRIAEQEKQLQELIGKAGAVDGGRYSGSSLNKAIAFIGVSSCGSASRNYSAGWSV